MSPIESTFARVRHRTKATNSAGLAMAFKLIEAAQDRWRAVNARTSSPWSAPERPSPAESSPNEPATWRPDIPGIDPHGRTPLHYAALANDTAAIRVLLSDGVLTIARVFSVLTAVVCSWTLTLRMVM